MSPLARRWLVEQPPVALLAAAAIAAWLWLIHAGQGFTPAGLAVLWVAAVSLVVEETTRDRDPDEDDDDRWEASQW